MNKKITGFTPYPDGLIRLVGVAEDRSIRRAVPTGCPPPPSPAARSIT
jgi:hypothetical protein